jgi:hypothetical protein
MGDVCEAGEQSHLLGTPQMHVRRYEGSEEDRN